MNVYTAALQPTLADVVIDWLASLLNMFNEAAEDRGDDIDDGEAGGDTEASDADPAEGSADEDDGDADPDGDDDGDGDDDDAVEDDKKSYMIPKSRYDYQANRAKNAEDRANELEAKLEGLSKGAVDEADEYETQLTALDKQIEEARADNDVDKVVDLTKKARGIEREMYQNIADNTSQTASSQAREQIKLDSVIEELESQYDFLQEDSKAYDQDLVNEILDLQEGYVRSGRYTPSQAMQRAASVLIPAPTDVEDKGLGGKRKTDVSKNLDAAKKIPPSANDKGENSDKGGDIEDPSQLDNMSMSDFDALPEETKKRLRGDVI